MRTVLCATVVAVALGLVGCDAAAPAEEQSALATEAASVAAGRFTPPFPIDGCPGQWVHTETPDGLAGLGGYYFRSSLVGIPSGEVTTLSLGTAVQRDPHNIAVSGTYSATVSDGGVEAGVYMAWPRNPANGSILSLGSALGITTNYAFPGFQHVNGRITALCLVSFERNGQRANGNPFVVRRVGW